MTDKQILQQIRIDYRDVKFVASNKSRWDPKSKQIFYNLEQPNILWSVLHEIGHMQAGHSTYKNDLELLKMESEAWTYAKQLSKNYNITIENDYIEDCLDSYRDWLHKRSSCTRCSQTGLQTDNSTYICVNCGQQWRVSKSRFCRSYRINTKTPS